ncbi:N-acetyl-gamma-glutamyl-phosphate reductase [Pelagibaculum spongiae]|uniref:N-acetyl-gamma-glutamyl-phosphate reductase n=1 Tax=Pelagibaculum spongiae TaxID=2080658 RepID=A0A2V1GSW1_9GAMM|nr:N-acetyl-gamma-glutamyl-phosphate reductase [Pelagibaculum spongiae]PVZ67813.1 N-acetyl-gamma-glutamyl-phosphate reductase [Pelagibaculum spongiae]
MIKVGIVGATGYTGVELLRLLAMHPEVELKTVTSRGEAGKPVSELFPSLRGHLDICFSVPDAKTLAACDVVFFATPHGVAHGLARPLMDAGVKIIDLSADFRIKDIALWEKWYGQTHGAPELAEQAVYGLPETNREQIAAAQLVACPGCYPTAVQLGLLPLLEHELVDASSLIADCKSGVSGGGRGAKVGSLMCESADSMKAYAVGAHRHSPEIVQQLSLTSIQPVKLTFVPHLSPMIRGIHATLYARLNVEDVDIQSLYEQRYINEPFVDVMPFGSTPETRSVRGSNYCRIGIHRPEGGDLLVICSVIDNLTKGSSGQAIQIMNLMFGLPEQTAINQPALLP